MPDSQLNGVEWVRDNPSSWLILIYSAGLTESYHGACFDCSILDSTLYKCGHGILKTSLSYTTAVATIPTDQFEYHIY